MTLPRAVLPYLLRRVVVTALPRLNTVILVEATLPGGGLNILRSSPLLGAPEIARWAADRLRIQTLAPHAEPCPLETWPKVPSSYVLQGRTGQDRSG